MCDGCQPLPSGPNPGLSWAEKVFSSDYRDVELHAVLGVLGALVYLVLYVREVFGNPAFVWEPQAFATGWGILIAAVGLGAAAQGVQRALQDKPPTPPSSK